MKYVEKLNLFFKNKEISQKRVAEVTNVTPAMVSRYLRETNKFDSEFIYLLKKEWPELDLNYLFMYNNDLDAENSKSPVRDPKEIFASLTFNVTAELHSIERKAAAIRAHLGQESEG